MTTLLFVTGASRGIGQAVAQAFVQDAAMTNVRVCLLGRDVDGLTKTSELLAKQADAGAKEVTVTSHVVDLSELDSLEEKITDIFQDLISTNNNQTLYERAILINNAGSIDPIGKSSQLTSLQTLRACNDLNVTSSIWLSSYFIRHFSQNHGIQSTTVVNISSLCAIQPFKTLGVYCAGKAYRDMFHETMAVEEEEGVKILNYAPGAIETNMTRTIMESENTDNEVGENLKKMRDEKTYVKLSDTAQKLVNLVMSNNFQSGKHVDYWDEDPECS